VHWNQQHIQILLSVLDRERRIRKTNEKAKQRADGNLYSLYVEVMVKK
jgi:hypothetical protein